MSELIAVSIHRATGISGVTTAGANIAALDLPGIRVLPLIVGPASQVGTAASAANLVPDILSGWHVASWPDDSSPLDAMLIIRNALISLGARIVLPHDSVLGYAAAGSLAHAALGGVRCAMWHHSSGCDGDDVALSVFPLVDSWAAVSTQLTSRLLGLSGGALGQPVASSLPVPIALSEQPQAWVPNTRTLRLLYAGRLERRHKRVLDLATLANLLQKLEVRFRLTIAGTGPAQTELCEALHDHVMGGRVEFVGAVPQPQMAALYGAHDLTVLVSESEGMPLAVSESMAAGRGVAITHGCGEAAQAIADGTDGIIVPTGDMQTLANRLAVLASQRAQIVGMGSAARVTAKRLWSTDQLRQSFQTLIHAAMAAPPRCTSLARCASQWCAIMRALGTLGDLNTLGVVTWRSRWLAEQDAALRATLSSSTNMADEAQSMFPFQPTKVVLTAERLFEEAMAGLHRTGYRRIALCGAGAHTRMLSQRCPAFARWCIAIYDDSAEATSIAGVPIRRFDAARNSSEERPDAIIVSSDEWEDPLAARAAATFGSGMPIVCLYRPQNKPQNRQQDAPTRAAA